MEAIIGLVIEIGKCIVGPVKRQFNYLCCFNNNIQILREEAQKLKDANADLQRRADAEARGRVIYSTVETWLERASQCEDTVNRIENKIPVVRKGRLNLISRYSVSRKAKKTAEALRELHNNCKFEQISQDAPPASQESLPLGPKEQFETRKKIEEDVMEALRDRNINRIGLCGMGGIGKTTMAKRIMDRVKEEKLFDEVVMVVVSQQVELLKLQESLAEHLGLKLHAGDLKAREYTIRTRLRDTKGILIVVDDVWELLELEELGIPRENTSGRCTVLLTSRDHGVLEKMETPKIFGIEILPEGESWLLFKERSGECAGREDLHSVVGDVAKECKGLPVALVTVGRALRNKTNRQVWVDALSQLRSSKPSDLPEVLADVYKPLRLSYDYLVSERVRSIFLLCSVFEEDSNIDLEMLTRYGVGLDILEEHGNLDEARNKTCALIEKLKDHSLLLDGSDEHHVKMHDVVRDMAIYIAPEEQRGGFVINYDTMLTDWASRENYFKDCYWISITNLRTKLKFPVELKCPRLCLLMMRGIYYYKDRYDLPDSFFDGMQEIKVLSMEYIRINSLPPTTKLLKNLKTLHLNGCRSLKTISVVGELLKLEILSCTNCYSIRELPIEIRRLNRLRLLEIIDCYILTRIVPGVISNLISLEELKLRNSFRRWEGKESKAKENAALAELESLTKLTWLEIEIDDVSLAAEEICLPSVMEKYNISISTNHYSISGGFQKIHIEIPKEMNVGNWIKTFVRNTDCLELEGDGEGQLVNLVKSEKIKSLALQSCSSVINLVNTTRSTMITNLFPLLETLKLNSLDNLEEIIPVGYCYTDNYSCFRNLKSFSISDCPRLQYLFPMRVAIRCLAQLEKLTVANFEAIKDIFCADHDEMENDGKFSSHNLCRAFPKLNSLVLQRLPRLKAEETLNKIAAPLNLNYLSLKGLKDDAISNVWSLCSFFGNLKTIQIEDFHGIKSLMSPVIARNLVQLRRLVVHSCEMMLAVIADDDDDDGVQVMGQISLFPNLQELHMSSLPNLRSFCQWKHLNTLELPSLREVRINSCPLMETLSHGSLIAPKFETINFRIPETKDVNKEIQQCQSENMYGSSTETSSTETEV